MTAESSRKPSTEPARTPVENARLLLPQLTPGQRAVVGALIAECERLKGDPLVDVYALNNDLSGMVRDFRADLAIAECKDELARVRAQLAEVTRERDEATHQLECALEDTEKQVVAVTIERDELSDDLDLVLGRKRGRLFSIKRGAAAPNHCAVCDGDWERCNCESRPDPLDAELDRIVAAREPYGPFSGGEMDDDTRTAGLLADVCDAAFDDPHRAEVHGYAGILERVRELAARAKPEPVASAEPWARGDDPHDVADKRTNLRRAIARAANGMEHEYADTPDYVLADVAMDAIDAFANASRSRDKHAYIRTVVAPDDAASDDPHGLGEGWVPYKPECGMEGYTCGESWIRNDDASGWKWWRGTHWSSQGYAQTAREAAALALGKPTVAREIDWDAIDDASCAGEQAYPFQRDVMAMLRALVAELRRTGAIA